MNKLKLPIKERNFNETTITAIMEARVGCAESEKRIKLLLTNSNFG